MLNQLGTISFSIQILVPLQLYSYLKGKLIMLLVNNSWTLSISLFCLISSQMLHQCHGFLVGANDKDLLVLIEGQN